MIAEASAIVQAFRAGFAAVKGRYGDALENAIARSTLAFKAGDLTATRAALRDHVFLLRAIDEDLRHLRPPAVVKHSLADFVASCEEWAALGERMAQESDARLEAAWPAWNRAADPCMEHLWAISLGRDVGA